MTHQSKKLLLTGASGLLGRAIYKRFHREGWDILGTAFSRVGPGLVKLDLTDETAVESVWTEFKPTFVIHCAAQRFPDKVAADPDTATKLNVDVTKHLAEFAVENSVPFLYISTDYVFDGRSPPYSTEDQPNPVNLYGKTKLQGEEATRAASQDHIILRVPVLYGPVETLSESAVTVLLETLRNTTKFCKVSDYEKRCPSHVDDIAEICFQLSSKKLKGENVEGVYHWCGKEMFTKYTMILYMADVFNLPHKHITADPEPPAKGGTPRPYDTRLDTSRLQKLGVVAHTPFKDGIHSALQPWIG
ncbi:methionine adenosyltransferase 2 subunit beta [Anabrus simplex]|uniref:methionine adenosyltransferase 2 subunit beta n=1 Tax=Anabrus simplex TaxID=316456 RepID=UPI0035A265D9